MKRHTKTAPDTGLRTDPPTDGGKPTHDGHRPHTPDTTRRRRHHQTGVLAALLAIITLVTAVIMPANTAIAHDDPIITQAGGLGVNPWGIDGEAAADWAKTSALSSETEVEWDAIYSCYLNHLLAAEGDSFRLQPFDVDQVSSHQEACSGKEPKALLDDSNLGDGDEPWSDTVTATLASWGFVNNNDKWITLLPMGATVYTGTDVNPDGPLQWLPSTNLFEESQGISYWIFRHELGWLLQVTVQGPNLFMGLSDTSGDIFIAETSGDATNVPPGLRSDQDRAAAFLTFVQGEDYQIQIQDIKTKALKHPQAKTLTDDNPDCRLPAALLDHCGDPVELLPMWRWTDATGLYTDWGGSWFVTKWIRSSIGAMFDLIVTLMFKVSGLIWGLLAILVELALSFDFGDKLVEPLDRTYYWIARALMDSNIIWFVAMTGIIAACWKLVRGGWQASFRSAVSTLLPIMVLVFIFGSIVRSYRLPSNATAATQDTVNQAFKGFDTGLESQIEKEAEQFQTIIDDNLVCKGLGDQLQTSRTVTYESAMLPHDVTRTTTWDLGWSVAYKYVRGSGEYLTNFCYRNIKPSSYQRCWLKLSAGKDFPENGWTTDKFPTDVGSVAINQSFLSDWEDNNGTVSTACDTVYTGSPGVGSSPLSRSGISDVGTPRWIHRQVTFLTGLLGAQLTELAFNVTDNTRTATSYCSIYKHQLERFYLQTSHDLNVSAKGPAVSGRHYSLIAISRLWERVYLQSWAQAQFGSSQSALNGSCLWAEYKSSGVQAGETMSVWVATCNQDQYAPHVRKGGPIEPYGTVFPLYGCSSENMQGSGITSPSSTPLAEGIRALPDLPGKDTLEIRNEAGDVIETRTTELMFPYVDRVRAEYIFSPATWWDDDERVRSFLSLASGCGLFAPDDLETDEADVGQSQRPPKSDYPVYSGKILPTYGEDLYIERSRVGLKSGDGDQEWFDTDVCQAWITGVGGGTGRNGPNNIVRANNKGGDDQGVGHVAFLNNHRDGSRPDGLEGPWVNHRSDFSCEEAHKSRNLALTDEGLREVVDSEASALGVFDICVMAGTDFVYRALYALITLLTSIAFFFSILGLTAGAALAQIILAMIFMFLPMLLVAAAIPVGPAKRLVPKVAKVAVFAALSLSIFMLVLSLMVMIIDVLSEAVSAAFDAGTIQRVIGLALIPIIAKKVLGGVLKQFGLDITGFKGALKTTSGVFAASGMGAPPPSQMERYGRQTVNRYVGPYGAMKAVNAAGQRMAPRASGLAAAGAGAGVAGLGGVGGSTHLRGAAGAAGKAAAGSGGNSRHGLIAQMGSDHRAAKGAAGAAGTQRQAGGAGASGFPGEAVSSPRSSVGAPPEMAGSEGVRLQGGGAQPSYGQVDTTDYRALPGAQQSSATGGRAGSAMKKTAAGAGRFARRHPFMATVAVGAAGGVTLIPAAVVVGGAAIAGKKVASYPVGWAQRGVESYQMRRQQRRDRDESAKELYLDGAGSGVPHGLGRGGPIRDFRTVGPRPEAVPQAGTVEAMQGAYGPGAPRRGGTEDGDDPGPEPVTPAAPEDGAAPLRRSDYIQQRPES